MAIDERLDSLTVRHKAFVQQLGLFASQSTARANRQDAKVDRMVDGIQESCEAGAYLPEGGLGQ